MGVISIVATAALMLKHQAISVHSAYLRLVKVDKKRQRFQVWKVSC